MPSPLAAQSKQAPPAAPPQRVVPFIRGTVLHTEPFYDATFVLTANQQNLGPIDITTFGFLRALWIKVDCTAVNTGSPATVAFQEDAPWALFAQLQINDVNGAPLFGPHAGYEVYCHHRYGGFRAQQDPKLMPTTSYTIPVTGAGATGGSFAFALRINLDRGERDGFGALANMNASSAYKLSGTIGNLAAIYSTAPFVSSSARIRISAECYSQPNQVSAGGQPQATVPPANGSTGYSSRFIYNANTGQNVIKHSRVGNYIRNQIYIARRAGTSRANGQADMIGQQLQWFIDSRLKTNQLYENVEYEMAEIFDFESGVFEAAGGPDNGVFVMPFMQEFDGKAGYEMRDLWMPTTQASRWELQVPNLANAGTIVVMTDDVSPNGNPFTS